MESEEGEAIEELDPYEMHDRGTKFATQGLMHLCNIVTFSDLKKLRLVCTAYMDNISLHRRFRTCQVTFRSVWASDTLGFRMDLITNWNNLTLRFFPLRRNPFFNIYWPVASPFVKTMKLDSLKVSCLALAKILNIATQLESVTFNRINFDAEKGMHIGERVEDGMPVDLQWMATPENPHHQVHCNHDAFEGEVIGPKTIKLISITDTESFPICILDLLEKRSEGVLENFSFEYNREGNEEVKVYPSMAQFQANILRICAGSRETLKTFSWVRNKSNGNVISTLREDAGINFDKLTIAIESMNFGRWGIEPQPPVSGDFLRTQTLLTELNIAIYLDVAIRQQLEQVLPLLLNLQKMKLQIDSIDWNVPAPINIFVGCLVLRDLTIIDNSKHIVGHMRFDWRHEMLTLEHMWSLPISIQAFTCAHRFRTDHQAVIANPTFRGLTKLIIIDGTTISNAIFQLLIQNMTNLQVFSLWNGTILTDTGVTGLDPVACKVLLKLLQKGLLFKEPKVKDVNAHSIREWISLRELDFNKCPEISDVSACYAMRFPELRKLTLNRTIVSDTGLSWLGAHNPNLHTLAIRGCQRITHWGLNRLISITKSVQHIEAKKKTCTTRPKDAKPYVEHPLFYDIVCTKKKGPPKRSYFDRRESNFSMNRAIRDLLI